MIEQIIKQVNPKLIPLIFIVVISLTLLASYLYIFKSPWSNIVSWKNTIQELKYEQENATPLALEIEQNEKQISLLEQELHGIDKKIPAIQLVSHIIKQLDQIAKKHNVTLGGVTPSDKTSILMFDETPFHIEINGNYHDLYDWLLEVKTKLRPLIVKEFEIQPNPSKKNHQEMRITIASYRQNSELL